jgi:hypothetical protein
MKSNCIWLLMNGAFAKKNLSDAPRVCFVKQNEHILDRKGQSANENSIHYSQKTGG